MLTSNLSAGKRWFLVAALWTVVMGVLCLVSFEKIPVKIKSGSVDKIVHFTFHFLFTFLWYGFVRERFSQRRSRNMLRFIVLASLAYGMIIEFAQEVFTATREADIFDVLANLIGSVACAILVMNFWRPKIA